MRRDKLLVLLVFAVFLAGMVGFRLVRGGGEGSDAARAAKPLGRGGYRGVSIQVQSGYPGHPYEKYIDEIADQSGANTVCLVVCGFQENASSTSIFIDARKAPTERRLRQLIEHARSRGLRVVLMPIVLLENARENEWRGKIAPTNWDDWWEDYEALVLHYAKIAGYGGVDVFMVGSELVTVESQTDRWKGLIAKVRPVYKGLLSYSANWDHYRPIKWWRQLDMIGMTTYYDLTGGKKATIERLLKAWVPIKKEILAWRETIGLPIMFTEVAWPNQVTCAQYPWDYYRAEDKPDPTAQANCFEAFFRTWIDEKSIAGFLVWEWRSYPQQPVGPADTSYVPCGKPALKVIREYFSRPILAATSRPAEAASQPAVEVTETKK